MNYSTRMNRHPVLARSIWSFLIFCASLARAGAPDATIQCQTVNTFKNHVVISCHVINARHTPIYLLLDDLILEGPVKSIPEYLYMPLGGFRYENVLQYHQKSMGSLEFGELFDPWTTIKLKKLDRLTLLEKGVKRDLSIDWFILNGEYPREGKWIARLSLLYLPQATASQLLRKGDLPPVCRSLLSKALNAAAQSDTDLLRASRQLGGREFIVDGCHDVISRAFRHLFSNTFEIVLD